jgi:hypothetical protein
VRDGARGDEPQRGRTATGAFPPSLLPPSPSAPLPLLTPRRSMTLREEYDKFKSRTNIGFLFFPLVWILTSWYLRHTWRYTHWIHILTHVWLLYYYVSLSLRENILKVVSAGGR